MLLTNPGTEGDHSRSSPPPQRRKSRHASSGNTASIQGDGSLDETSSQSARTPSQIPVAVEKSANTYISGLLKDTKHAIHASKELLEDSAGLLAIEPTLRLLVEGFVALPNTSSDSIAVQIGEYLESVIKECIPTHGALDQSDSIEKKGILLLARTLLDRCLSLIDMHEKDKVL